MRIEDVGSYLVRIPLTTDEALKSWRGAGEEARYCRHRGRYLSRKCFSGLRRIFIVTGITRKAMISQFPMGLD
jgi:hypothetical protein